MKLRVVLSHYQAAPILAAWQARLPAIEASLDLGRTRTTLGLSADGVTLPDGRQLSWASLAGVVDAPNKCFTLADDGDLYEIRTFSEATNWVRTLFPTRTAPTALVSGLTMHRIEGIDPLEDTARKIRTVRPMGQVLDTATGLGYTAIYAARTAEHVSTVEVDPVALKIARLNPWSDELFDNPRITQYIGDAFDVIAEMDDSSFSCVIHDPPAFALAGHLYSTDFYHELYRVLRGRGRVFHYVGDPKSKTVSRTWQGVIRRLHDAGFSQIRPQPQAFGIVAYK
ncbi:MAG: methyltransferase [Anaerolineae bacterium]|nr:methyltransferase [Anaerolineae bacterium]